MEKTATQLPVKSKKSVEASSALPPWQPIEALHRQIDRLFEDFDRGFWASPFQRSVFAEPLWRRSLTWDGAPAADIVETEKSYEITAELPGLDEKDVEVKLVNGGLTIKGEKQEEKEEKKKDYYVHERHFGSFERSFQIPDGVDVDKIEASFNKGVLKVTLPKKPEAQKPEKKIEVKAA
jgi:HSP20 family protein